MQRMDYLLFGYLRILAPIHPRLILFLPKIPIHKFSLLASVYADKSSFAQDRQYFVPLALHKRLLYRQWARIQLYFLDTICMRSSVGYLR